MKAHIKKLKVMGACHDAIEFAEQLGSMQAAWDACEYAGWLFWYVGKTMAERGSASHRTEAVIEEVG